MLLRVRSPRRGGERRLRRGLIADADPQEERRQDLGSDHTPTSGGRVLPAQPADPRPVDLRPTVLRGDEVRPQPYSSPFFLSFFLLLLPRPRISRLARL
jgi:hypothetical protein